MLYLNRFWQNSDACTVEICKNTSHCFPAYFLPLYQPITTDLEDIFKDTTLCSTLEEYITAELHSTLPCVLCPTQNKNNKKYILYFVHPKISAPFSQNVGFAG